MRLERTLPARLLCCVIFLSYILPTSCTPAQRLPGTYGVWADDGGKLVRLESGERVPYVGSVQSIIIFSKSVPMIGSMVPQPELRPCRYIKSEVECFHRNLDGPVIETFRKRGDYWLKGEGVIAFDTQPVAGQPEMIRMVPRTPQFKGGFVVTYDRLDYAFSSGSDQRSATDAAAVDKLFHTVKEMPFSDDIIKHLSWSELPKSEKVHNNNYVFKTEFVAVDAQIKVNKGASSVTDITDTDRQEKASSIPPSQAGGNSKELADVPNSGNREAETSIVPNAVDAMGSGTEASKAEKPPVQVSNAPSSQHKIAINGIGPVRVGMLLSQLESAWGGSLLGDTLRYGDVECYYVSPKNDPEGLKFWILEGKLAMIQIYSSAYATRSGARIGDTSKRLRELYGAKLTFEDELGILIADYIPVDPEDAEFRLRFRLVDDKVDSITTGLERWVTATEVCL